MRIYIAGPFFNPVQTEIIATVEDFCVAAGHEIYSPRLHSGSHLMSAEDRKDFEKWRPVLRSNIDHIDWCKLLIAVVEYAMPHGNALAICKDGIVTDVLKCNIELPDNGTVFECGYAYAKQKPVLAFHRTKQLKEMNLMLSHTMNGFISGYNPLLKYLEAMHNHCFPHFGFTDVQRFQGVVE